MSERGDQPRSAADEWQRGGNVSEHGQRPSGTEEPRVVVRDRRRIDPRTGEVREPAAADQPDESSTADSASALSADEASIGAALRLELDERTADLQRLTAEYANYRKRVERDREVATVNAKAVLAGQLLTVLDDIDRAEAHGDLTGAFKSVADKLAETLRRAGLEPFGHEGEPFDPLVHEAVQHDTSSEVDGPTVTAVLRRGYRFGDRVVRAALVAVTDHEPAPPQPVTAEPGTVEQG